jgi:preprotein translocase subunit SecB
MHANGPAMLFGAAREIIRAATGRGPWSAVIIPATNFLTDLPPLEVPAKHEEINMTAPAKKAAAKKGASKVSRKKTP